MKKTTEIFNFSTGKIVFFRWKNEKNWPVDYVSPSIKHIFGYESEDFLSGKLTYSDLIHPQDIQKVSQEIFDSSSDNKEEFTHKLYRLKDSTGQYRFIYNHTQVIRDKDGNITHYQGYISDETEIIEQKERLELVLTGTDLGLWDWNPQTNNVVFDERWANMLGYTLSEINPSLESWESKVHPDDIAKCFEDIQSHIDGKTNFYSNIHRMMHKDGKWRYILDRGKIALRDEKGNPVRFTGTHTDITHIKDVEIRLQKKQKKIDKYVDIIDENVITSSTNLNGTITYTSKAFCSISGYSKKELLGNKHNIVKHPDMNKKIYDDLWKTITQGKTWKGELKNQRKDGSSYWVEVTISSIYNDKNKKIGYTSIRHDITDKKRIEKISITDGLTNIYNRRHFNEVFPKVINSAKRDNKYIFFSIIDIDYFKQYNDTYGHQMGDTVLIKVAKSIKNSLHRADDYCFRIGGEEFGVLLKCDSADKAIKLSNSIRENIENLQIEHKKNTTSPYVTISMGLICKNANDINNIDELYKKTDILLYRAKSSGRNQVAYNI